MTTVNADRLALREAEAVKPAAREEKRPSFEPHIRQRDAAEATERHAEGNALEDAAQLRASALQHEDLRALPLVSTGAEFGERATIYPQGLAVVGYLSMLPPSEAAVAAASEGSEGSIGAASHALFVENAGGQPFAQAKSVEPPSRESSAGLVHDVRRAQLATDSDGDTLRMSADGPEFAAWLLRRLTFSGKGANATLRLRDYRLAQGDHRALVGPLASIARDHGWPVARIVVNGHEIWRQSAAVTPHYLPGEEPHGG